MKHETNLYNINLTVKRILDEGIDEETGEITNGAVEKLNALQISKQELIKNTCLYYKSFNNFIDNINKEIERLTDLKRKAKNNQIFIKNYLTDNLTPGEKIENEFYNISWRKSSKIVEDDEFISLELLKKNNKNCVREKTILELNKKHLTELAKQGKPLPEGISYITKNNLTIK